MPLFPAGRRWFISASWATLVVSLLHTLGNTLSSAPPDAAYRTLESTMRGYTMALGLGMVPSMWDINRSLVFTMSICLAALGVLGVLIGQSRDTSQRLLRPAALLYMLASAALTFLFFVYKVTPAFVSMAVVTVLFLAAVFEAQRGDGPVWR
jgi:hypothetical protein